jgi:histidyl-tRNA synthetase
MTDKQLSTDAYKGVRDFYPEDAAIQQYIFDTWSKTAESFGFERYDASILEPSDLYRSKGAENEEMVNEQTYTFTDRGNREVTLRPEMTPTVARMVAGKQRTLSFPLRWYSIPNLFRYERPQRGRLREHWQLNCDIFGSDHFTSDVEIITLAYQMLINFGAQPEMFEIRINNRAFMDNLYRELGITDVEVSNKITKLNDRKSKIKDDEYFAELISIVGDRKTAISVVQALDATNDTDEVMQGLKALDITNVKIDRYLARGFNYYTGTIFEIFDVSGENNRSMLGGGRYDNLTEMFGSDAIAGVGFGMGDVTMRDFLETHDLMTSHITAPTLMLIPTDEAYNLEAQKIAQEFRYAADISVATDISTKKIGKKIGDASDKMVEYVIVIGENDVKGNIFTLKNLASSKETKGSIAELTKFLAGV